MKSTRLGWVCAALVVQLWPFALAADVLLVGPQFEANSVPLWGDIVPAVAAFPHGGFVIAWAENIELFPDPPLRAELMVRRFNRSGLPLGPELVVNTYTTGWQGFPTLDASPCGFVIGWESDPMDGANPQFGGVRRYDASGAALTGETRFSDVANDPVIAADARGAFAVVWTGSRNGQGATLIRRVGDDATISDAQDVSEDGSSVWPTGLAMLSDGTAVAVFAAGGIRARRFDARGAPLGPALVVSDSNRDAAPEIVADPRGGFVVVWSRTGSGRGILARRFSGTGDPAADEIVVVHRSQLQAQFPAPRPIAISGGGDLLVVWSFAEEDGSSGIAAQHVDSLGRPVGPEAIVSRTTTGLYVYPSVASDRAGSFIVVWNYYQTLTMSVLGQRLTVDPPSNERAADPVYCPGDCDGNGQIDAGEIDAAALLLFDGQAPCRCPALDADGDHRATAADLISTISAAAGCLNPGNQP